ncbi:lectin subunit alpha [Stomoxys calcitrans]|uniref:C-type lectin domain-containing protein n=1 Tax=Stomoxys calcitrans TaxID=35570 RepID=A0A1I8P2T9_STOCA|nr:lectin subunit alpha [Stomoxys calcitrans]
MERIACFILLVTYFVVQSNGLTEANYYTSPMNKIYYIEPQNKYNWFGSLTECTRMNMSIITVDSAEKTKDLNDVINTNFKDVEKPLLYIGGSDMADNGKYVWHSTGNEFVYTNWAEYEPNNFEDDEHCVHIGLYNDGTWNDVKCSLKLGFICEVNKNEPQ